MEIRAYEEISRDEILPLYASVGWTNYTDDPDMLLRAFEGSLLTLGAYDGERLVGIIRAVGDGASIVFIQDILVCPEYQRRGIGTELLREVMNRFPDVYQMELLTDSTEKTVSFYRSLGFVQAEETGCRAFIRTRPAV